MKKYIIFLFSVFLLAVQGIAQVGINTSNPQNGGAVGVLHIDGQGNNNASGLPTPAQTSDDVLINSLGKMSIGHVSPSHMLHINSGGTPASPVSGIKIEDGSQGVTKLLISDVNGFGRWAFAGEITVVRGLLNAAGISPLVNTLGTSEVYFYTGSYIELPPGRWVVIVSMILSVSGGTSDIAERVWIRSTFCDTPAALASSADFIPLDGRWVSGFAYSTSPNLMNGFLIINNSTTAPKRYYYSLGFSGYNTTPAAARLVSFGSSVHRQSYILALKMKND